jgi:hypothetical protein
MISRLHTILLFFFAAITTASAQLKIIVPTEPVLAGEPFRVQYVLYNATAVTDFKMLEFKNVKLLSGPEIHTSVNTATSQQTRNYIFTLLAEKPGRYIIPGATAVVDDKTWRSNDAMVYVVAVKNDPEVSSKQSGSSDYFLRPGENPIEKVKQNLFVSVQVDKKTCYAGQPVMATFKLYSRLESKSDIIKNPGFYGFTVHDIVNLADKQINAENVNGKLFDVHTIRKVQLYPLQAGLFTIDEMQIKNRVEFSRSVVNKKTEQQIAEGLLGGSDDKPADGAEVFETSMVTEPINITVKPLPEKIKPANYNGAVGKFIINASVLKNEIARNEQGFLEIIIQGKGNFVQIGAPEIKWPTGTEGFEPVIADSLDKSQVPLSGKKVFRYGFVGADSGRIEIPSVSFSFFNPDSGTYRTICTQPVSIKITNQLAVNPIVTTNNSKNKNQEGINPALIVSAVILVLCVTGILLLKRKDKKQVLQETTSLQRQPVNIDELLSPVSELEKSDEKDFYPALHHAIWKFFSHHYNLSGSEMNKEKLWLRLRQSGVNETTISKLEETMLECEAGMFTHVDMQTEKATLLKETRELFEQLNLQLL